MISPDYVRLMARYNQWQNENLLEAAEALSEDERLAPRGAFFGSIAETFFHLLWADRIWLSRFGYGERPSAKSIKDSTEIMVWSDYRHQRGQIDELLLSFADGLSQDELDRQVSWYSGAIQAEMTQRLAPLVVHMFNHQTHHRGQIHAMLTSAGAKPSDTDLMLLAGEKG